MTNARIVARQANKNKIKLYASRFHHHHHLERSRKNRSFRENNFNLEILLLLKNDAKEVQMLQIYSHKKSPSLNMVFVKFLIGKNIN